MAKAMDYAKYFIKKKLDTDRDTFDGNMKLQKLLFFADFISISEYDELLFDEHIRAFKNGCVVEEVRLRYKNDCYGLVEDSERYDPNLSQREYDILNLTINIFGSLTARELSEINHTFMFWKNAYYRSIDSATGFKDKDLAIVSFEEMKAEKGKLMDVINTFKANKASDNDYELINGIRFYYDSDFEMTDSDMDELEEFSNYADESAYSIYRENGMLVIL